MVHLLSITVPKEFAAGPQFDEAGDLIPGSWPGGLPAGGFLGWVAHGIEKSNRKLVEALVSDEFIDDFLSGLPGGWTKASHHSWDLKSQDQYDPDTGDFVASGLTTIAATDNPEYTKHIDPPRDENGNPTGAPAEYRRIHKFQGWPDARD